MSTTATKPRIPGQLVDLARNEIGVSEIGKTNKGPRVNEYKAATRLPADQSWPWCAAFICWLIREALTALGIKETDTFKRPKTAGAWDFENWCKGVDRTAILKKPHKGDIQAGDIVIFTFSHIGLATGPVDSNGNVPTIEGNTDGAGSREGGAVLKKLRPASKIRSRIRFTA